MNNKKKLFIIAGETSGDIIGENLIKQLQDEDCIIKGVGGDLMKKAGCDILFHYDMIAVMGLSEVVSSYFKLMEYMKKTIDALMEFKPDLIITIDSPGFNFRLIKFIRRRLKFKAIHYVAPTVWAYNRKRVEVVKKLFDHILLILPFEKEYFKEMPHTFVGHPIVEDNSCLLQYSQDILEKDNLKLKSSTWDISIMVGSRKGEIKKHTKTIVEWINLMKITFKKDIKFHFLTQPHLEQLLRDEINLYTNNLDKIFINSEVNSHNEIIEKSVLGIVKSGTATMRFMANGTPVITFYKVSKITAWIMKRKLKIDKFNLCNIITNSRTIPELIQDDFYPIKLLVKSTALLTSSRENILNCYLQTWNTLKQDQLPSKKAGEIVKKYLKNEADYNQ